MRITLAAVGKLKASPEEQMFKLYLKRLPWTLTIKEIEIKKTLESSARKAAEAGQLLQAIGNVHKLIALDERGQNFSSEQLAQHFGQWQQHGHSHVGIVIGGADGLDESVRSKADVIVSFGALTWPHMLVRAMLAEQLYRVHTILSGHPYHRV